MARGFTGSFETELVAEKIRPRIFFEGDFTVLVLNLWTGEYNVTLNSKSWLGNGWLHNVSAIEENLNLQAIGARITLTGVPSELVSLILQNEVQQGKKGKIWLAFLDSTDAIVADPHMIFSGDLDYMSIQESSLSSSIDIYYESKLASLNVPKTFRYTDEGQKAFYPEDHGFEYVTFLSDWSGYWGRQEVPANA